MRPHIEFIHTEHAPLQPWPVGTSGAGARTLSSDPETDAATLFVSLPVGWEASVGRFTADVECYILQGRLTIGEYRLSRHTYCFFPAGVALGRWQALSPVTLIWFTYGAVALEAGLEDAPGAQRRRLIMALDSSALPWSNPITPGFPPGAMRKQLRVDPDTGAGTWLLGVLPQWRESRIEMHPVVEEAFVLQGEMVTDRGVMTAGCYFWRPPHIPHGPFHTDAGTLILFRTDGYLHTSYRWPE